MLGIFEKRSQAPQDFTKQVVSQLDRKYLNSKLPTGEGLAAVQFASWLVGRCFALAKIEGVDNLDQRTREMIGRQLVLCGELVLLDMADQWITISRFEVKGSTPMPSDWKYQLDIGTPDKIEKYYRTGDQILHFRVNSDPNRSWRGRPLWKNAEQTLETAIATEHAVAESAKMSVIAFVNLLGGNRGLKESGIGQALKTAIDQSQKFFVYQTARVESKSAIDRLDPKVDLGLMQARDKSRLDLLATCGIPISLFESSDGASQRESFRQLANLALEPMAEIVAAEFQQKRGLEIKFDFSELHSMDLQGRARAAANLVKAGQTIDDALTQAGLTN